MNTIGKFRTTGLALATSLLLLPSLSGCGGGTASVSAGAGGMAALTTGQSNALTQDIAGPIATMKDADAAATDANALMGSGSSTFSSKALQARDHDEPDGDEGDRQRLLSMPITINADGSIDLGNVTLLLQLHASPTVITYVATAKTFVETTTIEHKRHHRHFTSTDVTTRIFDASTLAATVVPGTIDTIVELKALNLTLLEVDHKLTVTNKNGTHTVLRTEKFSGNLVTVHSEIVNTNDRSGREVRIVRDSTRDKTTGIETGTATLTISVDGKLIKTEQISFTENHSDGSATVTITDSPDTLKVVIVTNADGTQTGTVTLLNNGQLAGNIQVDVNGDGRVLTAGGSLTISL